MPDNLPAKYDPSGLAGALRERIRDSLGTLIPDEEWDKMLRAEIAQFFAAPPMARDSWGHEHVQSPSPFGAIVRERLGEDVRARLQAFMEKDPMWRGRFEPGGEQAFQKMLADAMSESMPALMQALIKGVCGGVESSVMHNVSSMLREGR